MTIDPVATSIELYSKLLENAYAQAGQSQQRTATGRGETSTSTSQATVNYQLSVTVNARQEQRTTRGPAAGARDANDDSARSSRGGSAVLAAPANRQQTLLDLSEDPSPEDLQFTFELESSEILPPKRDARFATAADHYLRTGRRAAAGGRSEVGATFFGVA